MIEIIGRKGLKIYFNEDNPDLLLDDISLFGMSDKQVKEALKKPFVVTETFRIYIDYNKHYEFDLPKGYCWNGANVPPFCWLLIGQQKEPRFKLPSCVHDYMCEHHEVVGNDRYLSTLIFETLCEHFGRFNDVKCWAMFHSVDNFQKVCGKWGK